MLKQAIYIIFFVIFLNSAIAILEIQPTSVDYTVFKDIESKIQITITNSNNFTIYNITFSPSQYITYQKIPQLGINESITKNISILSPSIFGTAPFTSTVSFDYLAGFTIPSNTYFIRINDTDFSPLSINIVQGDTIIWVNNGTLPHTVTSSGFDSTVQPNTQFSRTFSSVEFVDYHDTNIGFHGLINVTQQPTQYVTNPDLYRTFTINLRTVAQGSSIEGNIIPLNYTARHNDQTEGLIGITNNGNFTAINIRLSSDNSWVSFQDSNFNLSGGANRYINFKINPVLTELSQSNKTYTINLKASGDNINEFISPISLFVPYEINLEAPPNSTSQDCLIENTACWKARKEFCEKYPHSSACDPAPYTVTKEVPVYLEKNIGVNYTQEEVRDMKTDITSIKSSQEQANKFIDQKTNSIDSAISIINAYIKTVNDNLNKTAELAEQNAQRQSNITKTIYFIVVPSLLGAGIVTTVYLVKRKKKKENQYSLYIPSK